MPKLHQMNHPRQLRSLMCKTDEQADVQSCQRDDQKDESEMDSEQRYVLWSSLFTEVIEVISYCVTGGMQVKVSFKQLRCLIRGFSF